MKSISGSDQLDIKSRLVNRFCNRRTWTVLGAAVALLGSTSVAFARDLIPWRPETFSTSCGAASAVGAAWSTVPAAYGIRIPVSYPAGPNSSTTRIFSIDPGVNAVAGTTCISGPTFQRQETSQRSLSAWQAETFDMSCPASAPYIASGGVDASPLVDLYVTASHPLGASAWRVVLFSTSTAGSARAAAVCSATPVTVTQTPTQSKAAWQMADLRAACPSTGNTHLWSGGFWASTNAGVRIHQNYPEGNAWVTRGISSVGGSSFSNFSVCGPSPATVVWSS